MVYLAIFLGTTTVCFFYSSYHFAKKYGEEIYNTTKLGVLVGLTMNDMEFYVNPIGSGDNTEVDIFKHGKVIAMIQNENRGEIQIIDTTLTDYEKKSLQQYGALISNSWDYVIGNKDLENYYILCNQAYYNEDEYNEMSADLFNRLDEYTEKFNDIKNYVDGKNEGVDNE